MKQLWSPWRMEFILAPKKAGGCVFCREKGKRKKEKNLVLHVGEHCYVLMNRYPYNNGHLMVVSNKHVAEIADLSSAAQAEMIKLTGETVKILKKVMKCQGANCGMNLGSVAGAGIAGHLHMHVVPRWLGDCNFMPVLSDVKSMPEHLEATYKKLKPYFDKL